MIFTIKIFGKHWYSMASLITIGNGSNDPSHIIITSCRNKNKYLKYEKSCKES